MPEVERGSQSSSVIGAVTARIDHVLARATAMASRGRWRRWSRSVTSPWSARARRAGGGSAVDRHGARGGAGRGPDWYVATTSACAGSSRPSSAGTATAPDAAMHERRRAAEAGRADAAETAQPVLGADAKRVVRAAKAAQTILGEHQDSVVTRQVLLELGVQAHLDGDSAFTFGLLHGHEAQHAVALEEEFGAGLAGRAAVRSGGARCGEPVATWRMQGRVPRVSRALVSPVLALRPIAQSSSPGR